MMSHHYERSDNNKEGKKERKKESLNTYIYCRKKKNEENFF